jgi:predicted phage-related endonuclease
METILSQYVSLSEQIKALTEQQEKLKKEIKHELGSKGEHKIGEFKISYAERTRIDLDKKKIEEFLGDKVKDFEKITGYEVLVVKKV